MTLQGAVAMTNGSVEATGGTLTFASGGSVASLLLDNATLVLNQDLTITDNLTTAGVEPTLQLHGGMGYSEEYHVSRYFRESRLMKIAPVSQEMVLNFLGEHVLGLPRSY